MSIRGPNAADDIVNRYLSRMAGARDADNNDATYHAQIHFMRRLLTTVDMAMEDEGIPESTRVRVLRTAMYGAPDESVATTRMEQQRSLQRTLLETPTLTTWRQ